jgi:hypothetical protein
MQLYAQLKPHNFNQSKLKRIENNFIMIIMARNKIWHVINILALIMTLVYLII